MKAKVLTVFSLLLLATVYGENQDVDLGIVDSNLDVQEDFAPPVATMSTNGKKKPQQMAFVPLKPNMLTGLGNDAPQEIRDPPPTKKPKTNSNSVLNSRLPSKKKNLVDEEDEILGLDDGENMFFSPPVATQGTNKPKRPAGAPTRPNQVTKRKNEDKEIDEQKDENEEEGPKKRPHHIEEVNDIDVPELDFLNQDSELDKREFFRPPSATISKPGATPASTWNNRATTIKEDDTKKTVIAKAKEANSVRTDNTNRRIEGANENEFLVDDDDSDELDLDNGENLFFAPPVATLSTSQKKTIATWANLPVKKSKQKPFYKNCNIKAPPICSTVTLNSLITESEFKSCNQNCKIA